jgi:hypothetical protein
MSEKIYTWLLKLYPARFRQDYGPSAMQLFRDRLKAERGIFRRCRFWLDVFSDLAISVPREHRRPSSSEPRMAGSFRISDEAVTAITKREAIIPAFAVGFDMALGLTIAWLGDSNRTLLFAAYVPLAILAMGQFCSIGKVEKRWHSYQLMVGPNRLELTQDGKQLTLLRSEILKVMRISTACQPLEFAATIHPTGCRLNRRVRERLVTIPDARQPVWLRTDQRPDVAVEWRHQPAAVALDQRAKTHRLRSVVGSRNVAGPFSPLVRDCFCNLLRRGAARHPDAGCPAAA